MVDDIEDTIQRRQDIHGQAIAAWDQYYRDYYARYKFMPNRGANLFTCKYYDAFYKIGLECLRRNINVRDYVSVVFKLDERERVHITPSAYTKEPSFEKYKAYMGHNKSDGSIEDIYEKQMRAVMAYMNTGEYCDEEDLLIRPGMPFLAWVRICYFDEPPERILKVYGHEAMRAIDTNPMIKVFLEQHRPGPYQVLKARSG